MQLFIIRHGIAIDEGPGLSDEDRYLTAEGRHRTAKVGKLLRDQVGGLDLILTSPLVRAVQTADIVARELECDDVRVCTALAPGGSLSRVDAAIEDAFDVERLALVGHEPLPVREEPPPLARHHLRHLALRDFGALVRLGVRAYAHAVAAHRVRERTQVLLEGVELEDQRGRLDLLQALPDLRGRPHAGPALR